MSRSKILSVKNVNITLGDIKIIEDLSFEVNEGEFITIVGPNGSGKTTLFRALIDTLPYEGEINWVENVVVGYVPQKLDIERNVPLSLRDFLESKPGKSKKNGIEYYLNLVHLQTTLLDKQIGSLSGGEFQRALVAFALMGKSNVLLFDEPTSSIDKPSEEQIYETLHRLQHEQSLTVITISHDLSILNRYSDQVLCINKRKICFGAPKEVLNPKTLTELYGTEHYKFFHHAHNNDNHN